MMPFKPGDLLLFEVWEDMFLLSLYFDCKRYEEDDIKMLSLRLQNLADSDELEGGGWARIIEWVSFEEEVFLEFVEEIKKGFFFIDEKQYSNVLARSWKRDTVA